jgi:hypothetical protein
MVGAALDVDRLVPMRGEHDLTAPAALVLVNALARLSR